MGWRYPSTDWALMEADVRFWAEVNLTATCWLWTAYLDPESGYGVFALLGKTTMAHRFAYERAVGPIPHDMVIDHLCRNRACVNPLHLEPVSDQINIPLQAALAFRVLARRIGLVL